MPRSTQLRARFGANIADSMTDATTADKASIKLRPATVDRLDGTAKLRGAMMVPVSRLVADPDQPRKQFDAEDLDRLATSIKARGVLQPIRVRWDDVRNAWVIVTGERRWRAALLLGMETIPAVEAGHQSPQETLSDQLVENALRTDLTPLEQARAIQGLMEQTGWTQTRVGEELGISQPQISKVLSLLKVPEAVQAKVEAGEMAIEAASSLRRVEPEAARSIAEQGGDRATIQRAVRERSGRVPRLSRYEDRDGDWSVTVVVRRPGVDDAGFADVLRSALTRLDPGV